MQVSTLVKLGSLAFDIAQDGNVQELAGMVHKAGKRRGLWSQPATGLGTSTSTQKSVAANESSSKTSSNSNKETAKTTKNEESASGKKSGGSDKSQPRPFIPFGPSWTEPPAWAKLPEAKGLQVPAAITNRLTSRNARQAMKWAGEIGRMLLK